MATSSVINNPKSLAWKFLKIDNDDEKIAVCSLCNIKLSRGHTKGYFNTTNMLRHLNTKHPLELKEAKKNLKIEVEKKKAIPSSSSAKKFKKSEYDTNVQPTIYEMLNKRKIWDINDHQSKKVHQLIGEMIAIDLQPFSIVEDIGFIRLLKHVCPNYKIPSRRYIKETVVKNIYDCIRDKIKNDIDEAQFLSFTSDGWTATTSNTSFISFTTHWLSSIDYKQRSAILRVVPFTEPHTAYNISECIQNVMEEFKIHHSKVHLFVRDNAPNMASGVSQAGFLALPCFLHTLQLVLNDAIFEQRYVKDLITVSKQIVGHFNHSSASFSKYEEYQNKFDVPKHKFIQDITTRWNSQYHMLQRISEQKTALISYCSDHVKPTGLETNQWHILEKLIKILKVFDESTNLLSKREATASEIIPNIKVIYNFFQRAEKTDIFNGLGSTLSAWSASAKKRFTVYLNDKNLILATYLDPRFKQNFLEDQYQGEPINKILIQWMCEDIWKISQREIAIAGNSPQSQISSEAEDDAVNIEEHISDFNFSVEACLQELKQKTKKKLKKSSSSTSSTSVVEGEERNTMENEQDEALEKYSDMIKAEMKQYQGLKIIGNSECIFTWWLTNRDSFKNLATLSLKYLSAPPSSVESERLFSTGGTIYSPKRNRLAGETGEMLMFLHFNLRVLNFEYDLKL